MMMNPGIILSGQQPDFVNTLARSTQAAQLANQNRDQNALRQLFQTQGPQIMAGNTNALNALAQLDPMTALGVQGKRQDMQAQQQRMGILTAQEKRAIEEHALKLSAFEREQQAAQVQQGLMNGIQLYRSGDLPGLNQLLSSVGENQISDLDEFPAVAAKYKGMLDILTSLKDFDAGPQPADEYGRYVQEETAAGRTPLDRIGFAQAKKGTEIIFGPDGQPIVQRGPSTAKPFTEAQSKDNVYSTRARGALEALEPVANALVNRGERAAEYVPFGLGRDFQTDEFQVAQQAGTEFLQAILRKDTGAAITQQETDSYGQVYLPQPGDGAAVLEAKRQARIRAINALESGMSPAQMLARDSALIKSAREGGQIRKEQATGEGAAPEAAPDFLSPEDADLWQYMTPLERKAVLGEYEAGQ